jgi:hypothetical protein
MCSTPSERLARIGEAIDKLAADSRAPDHAGPDPAGTDSAGADACIEDRLARIWAMVAELDPELARRVTDYSTGTGR